MADGLHYRKTVFGHNSAYLTVQFL